MTEPKPSFTYKLKAPGISEHAIYLTVVGGGEPEAFFVNSKAMESFQWITALMTSYSRQMSAGVPIEEIITDMKGTFDPNGSYFIDGGAQVHSVVHHMGLILEQHMEYIISTWGDVEDVDGCSE